MVYVNSQKFACESCIKGHRSSSCHHTDRPLFEVKKKGRPVSQCNKCRELRQSKRVHSKCTCNPQDNSTQRGQPSPPGTKPRRFIPIVPALPNGLRDVLHASRVESTLPSDSRQRVDSLLNPCNCKSVWKCKCRTSHASSSGMQSQAEGLATLARAAAMCCSEALSPSSLETQAGFTKHQTSRPGSPNNKRTKHSDKNASSYSPGPDLPPIYLDASPSSSAAGLLDPIPAFPTMPPISTITSLAGSGCTCGVQCACPGCVEHRGPQHVSKGRKNCTDGCGTCIDHDAGIALPGSGANASPKFLDRFFAQAAALPAPPTNRRMGSGVGLDPLNVIVYPAAARSADERGVAFGLVNLPKLECCGGQCACPNGRCGCGKSCDGSCADHSDKISDGTRNPAPLDRRSPVPESTPPVPLVARSCCAGKATTVSA